MNKRWDLVDFLKGFSISTIVLMHLLQGHVGGILEKISSFGGAGVHVFILCSGFGLYLSHLRKPLKYGPFLKRRFMKIYVPYMLVVLLSALIPFYNTASDKWEQFLSHVFLYKMFVEHYMGSYGPQLWFLSTILTFYLFFPLIVRFFERTLILNKWLPLISSLLVSLGWATLVGVLGKEDLRVWNSFFLQYIWEFILGMYIAQLYYRTSSSLKLPNYFYMVLIAIIGVGLTGYAGIKGGVLKLYNDVPSALGYLSLAIILYKTKIVNNLFLSINKISYEWYLLHFLAFGCVEYAMKSIVQFQENYTILALSMVAKLIISLVAAYAYSIFLKKIHLK